MTTNTPNDTDSVKAAALSEFVVGFDSLTAEEREQLTKLIQVHSYAKGATLIREDDLHQPCYFVLKGCLRLYRLMDGVEKTIQFYAENQAAVLFSKERSESYLTCLEDCVLIVGEVNQEAAMYRQFPKLEQITRAMIEQDFAAIQAALAHFITSTPEARYLNILKTRPDLLQRVPQHQLASYIGVTPESLSRIRKRIMNVGELPGQPAIPARRPAPVHPGPLANLTPFPRLVYTVHS